MKSEGLIAGLPTLMAIYKSKLEADAVRETLRAAGYPPTGVKVYLRLSGTDQVLDSATGQVASGQALTKGEITAKMLEHLETVVLLHPSSEQLQTVQAALSTLGEPIFLSDSEDSATDTQLT